MAAEWPRVIHGHYDADLDRKGPAGPLRGRVRGVLSGLLHGGPAPDSVEDTGARAARSARRVDEVRRRTTTEPTEPSSPPTPEPAPDDAPDP